MSNVFQFPEIQRTDPDKKPTFFRVDGFGQTGGAYAPYQAADGVFAPLEV